MADRGHALHHAAGARMRGSVCHERRRPGAVASRVRNAHREVIDRSTSAPYVNAVAMISETADHSTRLNVWFPGFSGSKAMSNHDDTATFRSPSMNAVLPLSHRAVLERSNSIE